MNWSEKLKILELQSEMIILQNEKIRKIGVLNNAQEVKSYLHLESVTTRSIEVGWMLFIFLKSFFKQLDCEPIHFDVLVDKYTRSTAEIDDFQTACYMLELLGYLERLEGNFLAVNESIFNMVGNRQDIPTADSLHLEIAKVSKLIPDPKNLIWLTESQKDHLHKSLRQLDGHFFKRTNLLRSFFNRRTLKEFDRHFLMYVLAKNCIGQQAISASEINLLEKRRNEARFLIKELRTNKGVLLEEGYIILKGHENGDFQISISPEFVKEYKFESSHLTTNLSNELITETTKSDSMPNEFFTKQTVQNINHDRLYFNKALQEKLNLYENILVKDDKVFTGNDLLSGKINLFFEGPPGCGKTAYAYQLAKHTNRDVFHVSWQNFRHKWIGESEKNLKSILDGIDTLSSKTSRKPIVLFNEAESFLSRRVTVERSADQGQNNNVSMLLEWMEKKAPASIVIFTANKKDLLDPAFARRINSISFDHPNAETRLDIWKYKFQKNKITVAEKEILKLNELNLTGAEIDKIFKNYNLHQLAYDLKNFDLSVFLSFAENHIERSSIGFQIKSTEVNERYMTA